MEPFDHQEATRSRPSPPPQRGGFDLWQFLLVISVGSLIAVTSFGAGMLSERRWDLTDSTGMESDPIQQVEEVADLISSEYYYLPEDEAAREAFRQQLAYDAIVGMTSGLEDRYTTFLVPDDAAPVAAALAGEYEGIGVYVTRQEGALVITGTMPGSPAERVGLLPGDVIAAADGHPLTGLPDEQALALVRGPIGTTVRLSIQRLGVPTPVEVDVERVKLDVPAVRYAFLPDGRVAHIQVLIFGDKTTAQLDEALRSARSDGATGLILDLRDNGGGWVPAAQEMVGRFVPADRGPALYEDHDPYNEDLTSEPIINSGEQFYDLPMVVLTNAGTASAAEIVVGALNDYGRAEVIGERTFGKGSVQRVHNFPDQSSARITVAQWLTPDKEIIQDRGIVPEVDVIGGASPELYDPQLQRAVRFLITGGWSDLVTVRW